MKRLLITLGIAAAGIVGLDLWLRRQPKPPDPRPDWTEVAEILGRVPFIIQSDYRSWERQQTLLDEHYAEIAAARARRT